MFYQKHKKLIQLLLFVIIVVIGMKAIVYIGDSGTQAIKFGTNSLKVKVNERTPVGIVGGKHTEFHIVANGHSYTAKTGQSVFYDEYNKRVDRLFLEKGQTAYIYYGTSQVVGDKFTLYVGGNKQTFEVTPDMEKGE